MKVILAILGTSAALIALAALCALFEKAIKKIRKEPQR